MLNSEVRISNLSQNACVGAEKPASIKLKKMFGPSKIDLDMKFI